MAAPELDLDPSDGPFGIAVSGGADSTALLLAARAAGLAARAATVDHGLRSGSDAEAKAVGRLCAGLGVSHDVLALTLSDGPSLQSRAREARYAALADWARRNGLGAVLLGHTTDDLAETFLMRLADGAGLDGLAAMAPRFRRAGTVFLRPLLRERRAALLSFVLSHGIDPVGDPSNEDPRFERARVRRLLNAAEIDPAQIAASAAALRDVRLSVETRTATLMQEIARFDRGDWCVDRIGLNALLHNDPEQARRVILSLLRAVSRSAYPPRRAEQRELMRRVAAREATTLSGCLLTPERDGLRIAREPEAASRAAKVPLGAVWDGRWQVEGPMGTAPELRIGALGEDVAGLDWRETGLPRRSLMASPAVRDGPHLIAAPIAAPSPEWRATPLSACDRPARGGDYD